MSWLADNWSDIMTLLNGIGLLIVSKHKGTR